MRKTMRMNKKKTAAVAGDKKKALFHGRTFKLIASFAVCLCFCLIVSPGAEAAPEDVVDSIFGQDAQTLDIVLLLTGLALIPTLVICLTGFTRIVIVLGFVRNAIGMQNVPPTQVVIGLALLLDFFVMSPVISEINQTAYTPYNEGKITIEEFADNSMVPIRKFMLEQTYKDDLEFFYELSHLEPVEEVSEIPTRVVIPSFLTSELKRAFQIGFFIYIPFIIIDMVVASTLMAMGMMMLPPAMISLPFKVLLFILVDGWQLIFGTLIKSFT
jgi:flagellar biosynthetic protein FliP